jgi:hypothetical protein
MTCLTSVLKYAGSRRNGEIATAYRTRPSRRRSHSSSSTTSSARARRALVARRHEEKAALEAHFAAQNDHPRCHTDMVRVSKWQHASSRRIGESCALLWPDWTPEKQTILVRKMKDPKNATSQKVVALPWDAQALLYEWAYEMDAKPELRTDEPRILPFNSKTCSQRYTLAKKKLGIENLHLHDDDRRDRGSRLIEEDGYSAEEAIQYTGHDTTDVFERTYMVLDPAVIAAKGRKFREQSSSNMPEETVTAMQQGYSPRENLPCDVGRPAAMPRAAVEAHLLRWCATAATRARGLLWPRWTSRPATLAAGSIPASASGTATAGCLERRHGMRYMTAHRYAWILAHGEPPDDIHILHQCDNPPCCNPSHLRLGTHADNMADQRAKGRHVHGERTMRNRLTYEQVVEIRKRFVKYGLRSSNAAEIAADLGVSKELVNCAGTGRTWKSSTGPAALLHPNRVRPVKKEIA